MLEYAVVIRTLGKSGQEYRTLLHSIEQLDPKPASVIVVLPEGYDPPADRLGWEEFVFSPKGMLSQREYGIRCCKTEYVLLLDDDLAFGPDFVSKLYRPLAEGKFTISAGPLLELFPKKRSSIIRRALSAQSVPAVFRKDRYVSILRTTGFTYNRINTAQSRYYATQSAAGACMFAKTATLQALHYDQELWVDRTGYGAHEDTVFFYKAHLRGERICIVSDAVYQHLDANSSNRGVTARVEYAFGMNRTVFWHRFIYLPSRNWLERIWSVLCIAYRILSELVFDLIGVCIGKRGIDTVTAHIRGIFHAFKWIGTAEYRNLEPAAKK